MLCDIGLKLQSANPASRAIPREQRSPLEFLLGLPFRASESDSGVAINLSQYFQGYENKSIANVVFGNNADPVTEGNVTKYDDGDGVIVICDVDCKSHVTLQESAKGQRPYSIYQIKIPDLAESDESNYIRLRFRVRDSGSLWQWQKVTRRRIFSVSDLRFNEFRETPQLANKPNFSARALPIETVNAFLVRSSKLKTTQSSPTPEYIRVLERQVWEPYLQRRVSRSSKEVFEVVYWRNRAPQDVVESDRPFRAYIEVERRSTLIWRPAIITAVLVFMILVAMSSVDDLRASIGWRIAIWGREHLVASILSAISLGVLWAIFVGLDQLSRHWLDGRKAYRWWEEYWFKLPK